MAVATRSHITRRGDEDSHGERAQRASQVDSAPASIRILALRVGAPKSRIGRSSAGAWTPGPGSIYFMVGELRKGALIVELPPTAGTTRRYVISNKGRAELEKLKGTVQKETKKQLRSSRSTANSLETRNFPRPYGISWRRRDRF